MTNQLALIGEGFPENTKTEEDTKTKIRLGNFFESFSWALIGGKRKTRFDIPNLAKYPIKQEINPDIFNYKTKKIIEVKSLAKGNALQLLDEQIAKYLLFFLNSKKQDTLLDFSFHIYKHNTSKPLSNENMLPEKMANSLAQNIEYMVDLPLRMILQMYLFPTKYVSRVEGGWAPQTKIKITSLNSLVLNPMKVIEEIGINKKGFKIKRYKSPLNFKVNNKKTKDFPIVSIKDNSPFEGLEEILKKINNQIFSLSPGFKEILFEEHSQQEELFEENGVFVNKDGYPAFWDKETPLPPIKEEKQIYLDKVPF